jgi:hypothetical protein
MGMLVPPSRMTESGIQMNCQNDAQLRATVVVVAIASGASGAVAVASLIAAMGGTPAMTGGPGAFLQTVSNRLPYVRGFFLLSMVASLLLVPAAVYLYLSLRHHMPGMVAVYTISGVADLLTRATSHAVVAIQGPRLMRAYQDAAGSDREFIQHTFTNTMAELAIKLDFADLLGGVWLIGIGWTLRRTHGSFALLTLVMGSLELLVGVGSLFSLLSGTGPHFIARMLLAPIWAIALGVVVARRPRHAGT